MNHWIAFEHFTPDQEGYYVVLKRGLPMVVRLFTLEATRLFEEQNGKLMSPVHNFYSHWMKLEVPGDDVASL